jgi:hypothetical protein
MIEHGTTPHRGVVWTTGFSRVYHLYRDCPRLSHAFAYRTHLFAGDRVCRDCRARTVR